MGLSLPEISAHTWSTVAETGSDVTQLAPPTGSDITQPTDRGIPESSEDNAQLLGSGRNHLEQEGEQLNVAKTVDKPVHVEVT